MGDAWLHTLRRRLTFGTRKRVIQINNAGPEHLRPIVHLLQTLGPVHVCLTFEALLQVPKHGIAVLTLRESQLTALNIGRPALSQNALHVVLLTDRATAIEAAHRAPDFMDWISDTVDAPPRLPDFLKQSLTILAKQPGVHWPNDPSALLTALGESSSQAPSPRDYAALVTHLRTHPEWCIVPITHPIDALRLRWALGETGRIEKVITTGDAHWPSFEPAVASYAEAEALIPTGPASNQQWPATLRQKR